MRAFRLALTALALLAGPGQAQIVPGTRAPESTAEAIDDAQSLLCTLAAAGNPMPGLNMQLVGGEGYTPLDRIPDALARFVANAPQLRVVQLQAPGDPVWVVHDPESRRCSIYSFTDAAPVEAKLLGSLSTPGSWRRTDATAGIDHAFEWRIARSVRLRTEIALPDAAGEPLVVVVRPAAQ